MFVFSLYYIVSFSVYFFSTRFIDDDIELHYIFLFCVGYDRIFSFHLHFHIVTLCSFLPDPFDDDDEDDTALNGSFKAHRQTQLWSSTAILLVT